MNFRDPKLIFVKQFRGKITSYFQVTGLSKFEIVLGDIESKGRFTLEKQQIENYIKSGKLKISSFDDLPAGIIINSKLQRDTIHRDKAKGASSAEMERRYKYVIGTIEEGIPAYTAKWLSPFIIQFGKKISDNSPPGWRTLATWHKRYVEAGWVKSALLPKTRRGNRNSRFSPIVQTLMNTVVGEYMVMQRHGRCAVAYREFLSRLDAINQKRKIDGLADLSPCSNRAFYKQFK